MSNKITEQPLRGRLLENEPLGAQSWFGCGGAADWVYEPADEDDLQKFIKSRQHDEPLIILGGLSNVIIRDGGIRGCVIRLGKAFAGIETRGTRLIAGAGALNGSVAAAAAKAGLGGLEFLSGIPGTVGGALRMNAGAYGREIKDVLIDATALMPQEHRNGNGQYSPPGTASSLHASCVQSMDDTDTPYNDGFREGARSIDTHTSPALELCKIKKDDMLYSYRHCGVDKHAIFTRAVFEGVTEDKDIVRARLKEIKARRRATQPITDYTGGSTFANPSTEELARAGLPQGTKAWQLVERVGGRGLKRGGAQMSEKHCNFMINTGSATAADLEDLGEELIARVLAETGLTLRWEIQRIGESSS